jgi:putative transcriptional regulator
MHNMDESLRGQLLIAAPSLHDHFHRTVVLVVEHTEDGAMGVVLNRPSEVRVDDAVPALAELAGEEEVVRIGGPVAPDAVVALGEFTGPVEADGEVMEGIGVVDPDGPPPDRVRVYAGYAGWGAGQLEAEIEQGAWIVEPASPEDPFRDEDLWSGALERKGGPFSLLATMPADPSLN